MDNNGLGGIIISKICNNCGAENNDEAKFCYKCAADIKDVEPEKEITLADDEKQCPNCKAVNHIEAKFCKNCAKPFSAEAQTEQEHTEIHSKPANDIQNEQVLPVEYQQNTAQPVLKKSDKKDIPISLLIGIIAVIIIAVAAVIVLNNKNAAESQTSISTTLNTTVESTTTETTTESTTQQTTTTTTQVQTSLDKISNINTAVYSVFSEEGGGFAGIIISFNSVENADGYQLKYTYATDSYGYQDIDSSQTKLYFATQDGPSKIEVRAFKNDDETIHGDWATIFTAEDYSYSNDLSYDDWSSLTDGYLEINPDDYLF